MNDPKAIDALKQFMNMGNIQEDEDMVVKIPDMAFLKNAIHYGVEQSKSLTEGDQGGNIGAFLGMFAGGTYLADKFFPNPMIMQKVATNVGLVDMLQHAHDPMAVAGLGGLAAAVLGCIAYNVFKKLKSKKEPKVNYDGPKEPSNTGDAEKDSIIDKILALPNMNRKNDNWQYLSQFDTKLLKNFYIEKGGKL